MSSCTSSCKKYVIIRQHSDLNYPVLLYFDSLLGSGLIIGLIHSEYGFVDVAPDFSRFVNFITRHSVSVFGVLGLQYWLSFRFNNVIIPVSIGGIMVIGAH